MNRAAHAVLLALSVTALVAGAALGKSGGVPAIPMNTEQEAPGATGDASGFFSYAVNGSELCYTIEVRDMTGAPLPPTSTWRRAGSPVRSWCRWPRRLPRRAPSARASRPRKAGQ